MKKVMSLFGLMFAFLLLPLMVLAQAVPPETMDQMTPFLSPLIQAIAAGDWNVVGGIVLMLLTVGIRQYALPKWEISSDLLPFVTALIGALAMGGLAAVGGVPILEGIKNGLVAGMLSGGAWSLFGKYITKLILGDKYVETDVNGIAK